MQTEMQTSMINGIDRWLNRGSMFKGNKLNMNVLSRTHMTT